MTGFFQRLLGGRKQPAGGDPAQGRSTVKVSRAVESETHVRPSEGFSSVAERKGGRDGKDAGPWFIGKTVGEIYQIRGVLGRGGMGIVYRGYETATQREIAVKVPLGKFLDDPALQKYFMNEAKLWSRLIHPHIVCVIDVYDFQTTGDLPAIFMDYCDGGSLADRLRSGPPLLMADALDIAIQVCWGMKCAHDFEYEREGSRVKGFVHRDLKPGNVLLTKDGKALVSDFGLAKLLDFEELGIAREQLKRQDEAVEASLSRGLAKGTPEYMPPEQWMGDTCKQSDIYAFGIMLYELFCGSRPFTANCRGDLWVPHCKVPPPDPRRLNSQIPTDLAELMTTCLAKQPSDRPQSFEAVAGGLTNAYQEVTGKAHASCRTEPPISRERNRRRAWWLIRTGGGCRLRGDLTGASCNYQEASKILRDLGDYDGLCASLSGEAHVYACLHNDDKATEIYQRIERVSREHELMNRLAPALGDQALVLFNRGELKKAMDLHKEQEEICRVLNNPYLLAGCLGNQARILLKQKDRLHDALRLIQESIQIYRELHRNDQIAAALDIQGSIYKELGENGKAMKLCAEAESLRRGLGIRRFGY